MTNILNPLDLLEKAINEHGSAAILTKHIEFFRDQLTALEKKNAELIERNRVLEQKSSALEGEKVTLNQQIMQLNEKIKNIQNSRPRNFDIIN
jgi:chromosome segregation ATPase